MAFDKNSELWAVKIPNSVTKIGEGAFEYCTGLTSIMIPKGAREMFEKLLPDELEDKLTEINPIIDRLYRIFKYY